MEKRKRPVCVEREERMKERGVNERAETDEKVI